MNNLGQETEILLKPLKLREDEYRDPETDLIMCSLCHTPREKRFTMLGADYNVRIPCRCRQEAAEAREARQRQMDFEDQIQRNRGLGMTEAALRTYTFANDKCCTPEMERARRYVDHWDDMFKKSLGLLVWGDVGTGKTFLAGCIANALLDKGVPVMMTNFARILNRMSDFSAGDKNRYLDEFNRYPLLILDDLGMERSSEFAQEQVFNVIDARYRSQLPMIVTTNLSLGEMKNPGNLAQKRVFDRVLERCIPLKVNGQNLRQARSLENMAQARALLEDSV